MPKDATISLRIDAALKKAVEALAEKDDRTVSQYIERLLEAHVASAKARKR